MERQQKAFLEGEGDAWFRRNKDKIGKEDPVSDTIRRLNIRPKDVLEFGCANGWRLDSLSREHGCAVTGVEPSMAANSDGMINYPGVPIFPGTCVAGPEGVYGQYDMIIYGFCLYLVDPEDLFAVVAVADKLLAVGGHIVIHDFIPDEAKAVPYKHLDGINSYKMNHAKLFLAHPAYRLVGFTTLEDGVGVSVLKKVSTEEAFPL